jgi:hypothetical protein
MNNTKAPKVSVCITAVGSQQYHDAARVAIRSILRNSPFPVFLGIDSQQRPFWTEHPRITTFLMPQWNDTSETPAFLAKFDTLSKLIDQHPDTYILQMDADALLVAELNAEHIIEQLGDYSFAMLEQTTITGSSNDREFFLKHYIDHTMKWFGDKTTPPAVAAFRYYNSGVVLSKADAMRKFLDWCHRVIENKPPHHRVGRHMIGDQDYFQYWANSLNPGQCRTLPWSWNHCEHWHDDFPRAGSVICHFSNFCNGPDEHTTGRMSGLLDSGIPES